MAKYSLEKEMKEQERRLKLRDSLRDTGMTQLSALEVMCKDIVRKMEDLKANHYRLEKNGNSSACSNIAKVTHI